MSKNKFEALPVSQKEVFIAIAIPGFVLPFNSHNELSCYHKGAIERLIHEEIIVSIPDDHPEFRKLIYGDFLTRIDKSWYCLTLKGEKIFWDYLNSDSFKDGKFDYMETAISKRETEKLAEVLRPLLNKFKTGELKVDTLVKGICKHRIMKTQPLNFKPEPFVSYVAKTNQ